MSNPFLGEIRIAGFNFAPRGWALCDGSLQAISQNSALFSLLGTTFGGDGQSTFGLPDLRGRAPIHWGTGPGLSNRTEGEAGGAESVTIAAATMPTHSHALLGDATGGGLKDPGGNTWGKKAARTPPALYQTNAPDTAMSLSTLTPMGGSQPHENLSPYLVLNFVIALEGIYPPSN